jgi:hypothetical protein
MRTALLFALAGCAVTQTGGPQAVVDPNGRVALDPSRRLVDLTLLERAALCDWSASMAGGYGRSYACGTSIYQTFPSREACVESRSRIPRRCDATVGESQACTRAALGDLCAKEIPGRLPECGGRLVECKSPPPVEHPLPTAPILSLANPELQRTINLPASLGRVTDAQTSRMRSRRMSSRLRRPSKTP